MDRIRTYIVDVLILDWAFFEEVNWHKIDPVRRFRVLGTEELRLSNERSGSMCFQNYVTILPCSMTFG